MYLGQNSRYKFYAVEVETCPEPKLKRLAKACEAVEKDVWNACEDFYLYLQRQSALIYAKHGDEVVGFALFDLRMKNDALIVAANECMVLRRHQGHGLPNIFVSILTSHIQMDNNLRRRRRTYRYVTFISSTVNYKLMEAFRRYSYLSKKSSFDVDDEILEIAREYTEKEKWTPIDKQNPFFIKAAFPNAIKMSAAIKRPIFVPESFIPERGDAYLFVCRIANFLFLRFISWVTQRRYGFKFSKRIIPISRITREKVIYSR